MKITIYTYFESNFSFIVTKNITFTLEYTVGMAGKVVEEIANDTNTRITVEKPKPGAKNIIFCVTGKAKDVNQAQFIFKEIVKSNIHKLNQVRPITNS